MKTLEDNSPEVTYPENYSVNGKLATSAILLAERGNPGDEPSHRRDKAIEVIVKEYKDNPLVIKAIEMARTAPAEPTGDTYRDYGKEASSFERLTGDDEIYLFTLIDQAYNVYSQLDGQIALVDSDQEQTFMDATSAHELIFMANLPLVMKRAKQYFDVESGGLENIDHLQVASIGLLAAIRNFKIKLGNKFSTLASPAAHNAVIAGIKNTANTIRVSSHTISKYHVARKKIIEFTAHSGRPTPEDVYNRTGITLAEYTELVSVVKRSPASLDAHIRSEDGDTTLGDTLADSNSNFEDALINRLSMEQAVSQILASVEIDKEELFVIGLHFGLSPSTIGNPTIQVNEQSVQYSEVASPFSETMIYKDIGQVLGIGRQQVGIIINQALAKLRRSSDNPL